LVYSNTSRLLDPDLHYNFPKKITRKIQARNSLSLIDLMMKGTSTKLQLNGTVIIAIDNKYSANSNLVILEW